RDANPAHARPYLTWAIALVNVGVFLYMASLGDVFALTSFLLDHAFVPAAFREAPGDALPTLFTSMFLHGGWAHLLSNMVFLVVFADNVEDRFGRLRFLVFYLAGGAFATLAHGLFSRESLVPLVGASGAISAVLGAYISLFPRQQVLTFVPPLFVPWLVLSFLARVPRFFLFWLPAWVFIGYWALLQVLEAGASLGMSVQEGGVAWWAHVGGFAFGLDCIRLLVPRLRRRYAGGGGGGCGATPARARRVVVTGARPSRDGSGRAPLLGWPSALGRFDEAVVAVVAAVDDADQVGVDVVEHEERVPERL